MPRVNTVARTSLKPLRGVGMGFGAVTLATLIALSTSIPAQSLVNSEDVALAQLPQSPPAVPVPVQGLRIPSTTVAPLLVRDGFTASSLEETVAARAVIAVAAANAAHPIRWPLPEGTRLNDHFGPRDCPGCSKNHGGQDFNPGLGAPIQSIADGIVSYVEDGERSLGVHVIVDHMVDGQLVSSVYAHMIHGSALVKAGDVVSVGQVLGATGSTGMSTGPHLHFEIRIGGRYGEKVDPFKWMTQHVR